MKFDFKKKWHFTFSVWELGCVCVCAHVCVRACACVQKCFLSLTRNYITNGIY